MRISPATIVIPTYNEEKDIENCLKSLLKQSYKNVEIIIVDDGSTDKTREIVRKFKKVRLIEGEHRGPGYSRNLGAKRANGDILIFVDADMTFDEDYVKKLIEPILGGKSFGTEEKKQFASNTNNMWSRCWGTYTKEQAGNKGNIFRAIEKRKFFEMGGFDPKYGYADDLTFYFKYGVNSTIVEGAVCYHKNPETLKEVYKQSRWIGASFNNFLVNFPVVKHILPILGIVFSPFAIPILSIRKCFQNNNFKIFFPWMLIFMSVRYFGTFSGLFRKVYLNRNTR